jgi:hypothetical protein
MSIINKLFSKVHHFTYEQIGEALASEGVNRQLIDSSLRQCIMVGGLNDNNKLELSIIALHIFLCEYAVFHNYANTKFSDQIMDGFSKNINKSISLSVLIEIQKEKEVYSKKIARLFELLGDPQPTEFCSEISSTFCEIIGSTTNYKMFLVVEKNIVPFVLSLVMQFLDKAKQKM